MEKDNIELQWRTIESGSRYSRLECKSAVFSFELELNPDTSLATIWEVDVKKKFRKMGYGNLILHIAEEKAKELCYRTISLYCYRNSWRYKWYQRHGYTIDRPCSIGYMMHLEKDLRK